MYARSIRLPATFAIVASFGLAGMGGAAPGTAIAQAQGPKAVAVAAWVAGASMKQAREDHSATRISDGRVLVAGGTGTGPAPGGAGVTTLALDTAEVYVPWKDQWQAVGQMKFARSGHSATAMSDGRVLVVGGGANTPEIFDPVTGSWTAIGAPHHPRERHTATLLPSGKVLIAGGFASGRQTALASAELFDPVTEQWTETDPLHIERGDHTATLLGNGKVLLAGGFDAGDYCCEPFKHGAEIYDESSGTWTLGGSMQVGRFGHAAVLLQDGRALVAGGEFDPLDNADKVRTSRAEIYDPVANVWTPAANPESGYVMASVHTATLLPDGTVVTVGSDTPATNGGNPAGNLVQVYVPSEAAWRTAAPLGIKRNLYTASMLPDGKVMIAGGMAGGAILDSVELSANVEVSSLIGPGFTGAWYDPRQSGHGLFIEVLTDNRFLAWWFTFNPSGTEQAWFGGVGTYGGNTAVIADVYQTTGGRFIPNFDSAQVVNNPWGKLTFTFIDCNHAFLVFDSIRGYGNGAMALQRLTLPAGLTCP